MARTQLHIVRAKVNKTSAFAWTLDRLSFTEWPDRARRHAFLFLLPRLIRSNEINICIRLPCVFEFRFLFRLLSDEICGNKNRRRTNAFTYLIQPQHIFLYF